MLQGTTGALSVRLQGEPPAGWHTTQVTDHALVLQGPSRGDGPRPRVRATATADDTTVEDAAAAVVERLRARRPEAVVVSSDIWPHPSFGEGRFVQSADLAGQVAGAHDVYVFVAGGARVEVEVDCALEDLLTIEEQVAAVVARLRLGAEVPR